MERIRLLGLVVLCLPFLGACGPSKSAVLDKGLESYVQSFISRTSVVPHSDIVFRPLDGTVVGLCEIWSNNYSRISVDREYFNTLIEAQKEELVYHELGHCELGRDHSKEMTTKRGVSVPKSVMFPTVFPLTWANIYDSLRDEYVQELIFGK